MKNVRLEYSKLDMLKLGMLSRISNELLCKGFIVDGAIDSLYFDEEYKNPQSLELITYEEFLIRFTDKEMLIRLILLLRFNVIDN